MSKQIIIVGAGVIGLFSALYASTEGHSVTLLEKGQVGGGSARGNAGEICPTLSDPLPGPGMVKTGLMNAFHADAALRIAFPPSIPLATWLARFALNCTTAKFDKGMHLLNHLSTRSLDLYGELGSHQVKTSFSEQGNLRCFADPAAAKREFDSLRGLAALNLPVPEKLIDGDTLRAMAPVVSSKITSGFHLPGQWFVNPSTLVDDLHNRLLELGVNIVEGTTVTSIHETTDKSVVLTTKGEYSGDAVIAAAGAWSDQLFGNRFGLPVVVPGKGYSFSVKTENMPQHVINLPQANAVATPLGDRLRLAGTMEFDGNHEQFHPNRIQRIVNAVKPYLNDIDWDARFDEWVGPRPMTVDGLPRIGKVGNSRGVYVATGHNMLGLTLAPASAELIVNAIDGREQPQWAAAFRPSGFTLKKAA
ncbi:NAD(P)/FAD-dependent oxidoreductase (plasmid) [Arthrobacter sp. KN11-1C]|uniref:NAD(P)/FAD-dependent oxidoreductase n=1 Tax=Arthrobacter sp. KN11-1C TaxID=3445774 RepID=UPI003FA01902